MCVCVMCFFLFFVGPKREKTKYFEIYRLPKRFVSFQEPFTSL